MSNRTGVSAHFYCTENNLSNFCVIINEHKKETFHQAITCSKLTIETPEQGVRYVQS